MKPLLVENEPPLSFLDSLAAINDLLNRRVNHEFLPTKKPSTIPTGVACVVTCAADDARCLAFATRELGRVRWYGVTAAHQAAAELREVRGYVVVDEALKSEVSGVSSW